MDNNQKEECGYKCGPLPECAPLAVTMVPGQTTAQPKYGSEQALARGTLFPGLDLPLGNIVNSDAPDVPLAELMALDFAAHDLSLYLDTHPNDLEAIAMHEKYERKFALQKKEYEEKYGPLSPVIGEGVNWLKNPWPWDAEGEEQ